MVVLHFYSSPGLQAGAADVCLTKIRSLLSDAGKVELKTELCYNVEVPDKGKESFFFYTKLQILSNQINVFLPEFD